MNPLKQLRTYGQSFWLDYMRRNLLTSGELTRLIEDDGLSGMTSNPTIFEKAIDESTDYDVALQALLASSPNLSGPALFEALALDDIRLAADLLRPTWNDTAGDDGYVSLEVSPLIAHDTARTIADARRLFAAVGRPNVMIKVPATDEGIPAIEALTADGVNVNITLIFSLAQYEATAQAYLRGIARAKEPARVASVASLFVSRIDTLVDAALEAKGTAEALALGGKVAIANARLAYRRFREIFHGDAFAALRAGGARVQRPLWGSTGTKNKAYSDVLYVEELIGPETVNTMPPATANAFRDHGHPRASLEEGFDEAARVLERLAALDVDLDGVMHQLLADGVAAFAKSFDALMQSLETKRRKIRAAGTGPDRQTLALGDMASAVGARLESWRHAGFAHRLWARDPTLWSPTPVPELANRLGWLTLHEAAERDLDRVRAFALDVTAEGIEHVVVLGMGGSSLAPDVFQATFGSAPGFPTLSVLDSTHPDAVRSLERRIRLDRTLFLISSKSGTTLESLSLFRYFWARVGATASEPGARFVAITDPGTPLETLARERRFRQVFEAPPDVGGRYSALSVFGTVPAALIGVDVHQLLERASRMAEAASAAVPEPQNPALVLGAALGELAGAGRDKVTFLTSPRLAAFPAWLEQLLAESTGKNGHGIVPIAEEPIGDPGVYGSDRFFVSLALDGDSAPAAGPAVRLPARTLEDAGFPVGQIRLADPYDLGREMFRWEMAVAAAGAVIGILPFDQPDVQLAKDLARQAMAAPQSGARGGPANDDLGAEDVARVARALADLLGSARAGDYFSVQAYLAPGTAVTRAIDTLRASVRDRLRLATTAGYGPRFLHSTGQLHKGGANNGIFLQLVDEPREDLAVPETDYTFGRLIRAQAMGDYQALVQRGRRVLRVNLGGDVEAGLVRLHEAWDRADVHTGGHAGVER
jgi:transaldolase/glucose-6-phosphate isomerase